MDPAGDDIHIAEQLLISTPTSENLNARLLDVYKEAKAYPVETDMKNVFDNTLLAFLTIEKDEEWTELYFRKAPTVAAMSILSKFKNDCAVVATIILTDIKKRLL